MVRGLRRQPTGAHAARDEVGQVRGGDDFQRVGADHIGGGQARRIATQRPLALRSQRGELGTGGAEAVAQLVGVLVGAVAGLVHGDVLEVGREHLMQRRARRQRKFFAA